MSNVAASIVANLDNLSKNIGNFRSHFKVVFLLSFVLCTSLSVSMEYKMYLTIMIRHGYLRLI